MFKSFPYLALVFTISSIWGQNDEQGNQFCTLILFQYLFTVEINANNIDDDTAVVEFDSDYPLNNSNPIMNRLAPPQYTWQEIARYAFRTSQSASYVRDRLKGQVGVGHLFVFIGYKLTENQQNNSIIISFLVLMDIVEITLSIIQRYFRIVLENGHGAAFVIELPE